MIPLAVSHSQGKRGALKWHLGGKTEGTWVRLGCQPHTRQDVGSSGWGGLEGSSV